MSNPLHCRYVAHVPAKANMGGVLAARLRCRIGAAPARVAPWQIPERFGGQGGCDKIKPGSAPWLAAQKPRQRHPAAGPQAVPLDGLIGIIRTGRQMPAIQSDYRR